jgi:hypothetical protein
MATWEKEMYNFRTLFPRLTADEEFVKTGYRHWIFFDLIFEDKEEEDNSDEYLLESLVKAETRLML